MDLKDKCSDLKGKCLDLKRKNEILNRRFENELKFKMRGYQNISK